MGILMGIYEQQLAQGRLLAMMPDHKRKVQKALADIRQMLAFCNAPYVSLSWGKQSICLMHLVYQIDQTVPGVFWREPETHIIADFDNVLEQFLSRWQITYFDVILDEPSHQKAAGKWEAINNKSGVFMGFARHESKVRRYTTAKADKYNIYRRKDGFYRSTPLRFWSDIDIAAYAALYDTPMLNLYHRFGFTARTSAGIEMGTADNPDHSEVGFDQMTTTQRHQILESQRRRKNGT